MTDAAPTDLAGEITFQISDSHADFFTRNELALRVEQRLQPHVRYAAYIVLPRSAALDPPLLDSARAWLLCRLRPWAYADRNPMPQFDVSPLGARIDTAILRAQARARLWRFGARWRVAS